MLLWWTGTDRLAGELGRVPGGRGRPYNSKVDQEWVMAPSEARGQTAVPITSRCGSKPLRDLEYTSRKHFLITNYLILVALAFSVGA
jgi:hypothetical protein